MAFHKIINALSLPTLALFTYTPLWALTKLFFLGFPHVVKQDKLSNLTFFSLTYPVRSRYYTFQINVYHNTKYEVQNPRNQHLPVIDYNKSWLA